MLKIKGADGAAIESMPDQWRKEGEQEAYTMIINTLKAMIESGVEMSAEDLLEAVEHIKGRGEQ